MAEIASDVKSTSTTQQVTQSTFTGLGNLVKLLPSGTFFLFQFFNPIITNNGECQNSNKYITGVFLGLCAFASCFSWFTDSYTDRKGKIQYGIVTKNGLYPLSDPDSSSVNLSTYKLRLGDFVHALLSVFVFAIVALLDSNAVRCFYPSFGSTQKTLIMALPPVIGAIASSAFVMFPNNRHGIGYPPSTPSQASYSNDSIKTPLLTKEESSPTAASAV
ncbi:hypothetical protein AQUCO_02600075v1 [Aquilegia coerulea]|uniref:DUF679 domain-containing protein n=1 Tax=Aquilegia coerulea TaxID=218851 RepID=A0A2G5D771_AQUCA|nr:hypothetical protein AQUCO_02600075v1 [Aquilegia coerulea]